MAMNRGDVSEMVLAVGAMLAVVIIVVAVWQLVLFQSNVYAQAQADRASTQIARTINALQAAETGSVRKFGVDADLVVLVRNGLVIVKNKNYEGNTPYVGYAESSEISFRRGEQACAKKDSGVVKVSLCAAS